MLACVSHDLLFVGRNYDQEEEKMKDKTVLSYYHDFAPIIIGILRAEDLQFRTFPAEPMNIINNLDFSILTIADMI